MATMMIRDDILWARHIEGDPGLVRRIRSLAADEPIVLRIEGRPLRFRKLGNSEDGRPTEGVRPEPDASPFWRDLQSRRGAIVTIEAGGAVDPYLLSLAATLTEWNSPDDAAAYDGL